MSKPKECALFEVQWNDRRPTLICHLWINRITEGLRWREYRKYHDGKLVHVGASTGRRRLRSGNGRYVTIVEAFERSKREERQNMEFAKHDRENCDVIDQTPMPADWAKLDGKRIGNGIAGKEN